MSQIPYLQRQRMTGSSRFLKFKKELEFLNRKELYVDIMRKEMHGADKDAPKNRRELFIIDLEMLEVRLELENEKPDDTLIGELVHMAGQLAARTHTSDDDLVVRVACALDKAELFHLELQPLQKKRKKALEKAHHDDHLKPLKRTKALLNF